MIQQIFHPRIWPQKIWLFFLTFQPLRQPTWISTCCRCQRLFGFDLKESYQMDQRGRQLCEGHSQVLHNTNQWRNRNEPSRDWGLFMGLSGAVGSMWVEHSWSMLNWKPIKNWRGVRLDVWNFGQVPWSRGASVLWNAPSPWPFWARRKNHGLLGSVTSEDVSDRSYQKNSENLRFLSIFDQQSYRLKRWFSGVPGLSLHRPRGGQRHRRGELSRQKMLQVLIQLHSDLLVPIWIALTFLEFSRNSLRGDPFCLLYQSNLPNLLVDFKPCLQTIPAGSWPATWRCSTCAAANVLWPWRDSTGGCPVICDVVIQSVILVFLFFFWSVFWEKIGHSWDAKLRSSASFIASPVELALHCRAGSEFLILCSVEGINILLVDQSLSWFLHVYYLM